MSRASKRRKRKAERRLELESAPLTVSQAKARKLRQLGQLGDVPAAERQLLGLGGKVVDMQSKAFWRRVWSA